MRLVVCDFHRIYCSLLRPKFAVSFDIYILDVGNTKVLTIPSLERTVKKCNRDGTYGLVYDSDGFEDPAVPLTHIIQLLDCLQTAHSSDPLSGKPGAAGVNGTSRQVVYQTGTKVLARHSQTQGWLVATVVGCNKDFTYRLSFDCDNEEVTVPLSDILRRVDDSEGDCTETNANAHGSAAAKTPVRDASADNPRLNRPAASFRPGDRVLAPMKGARGLHLASVLECSKDGTYVICYDDTGLQNEGVNGKDMQRYYDSSTRTPEQESDKTTDKKARRKHGKTKKTKKSPQTARKDPTSPRTPRARAARTKVAVRRIVSDKICGHTYRPGDPVEVKREDVGGWHAAVVEACNSDGSYCVKFDGDDTTHDLVAPAYLKEPRQTQKTRRTSMIFSIDPYSHGYAYVPQDLDELKEVPGRRDAIVLKNGKDDNYNLDYYVDGGVHDSMPVTEASNMVSRGNENGAAVTATSCRIQKQAYNPKDLVEVKRRDMKGWHEAIVQACNADGSYVVRFENDGTVDKCVNAANIKSVHEFDATVDKRHRRRSVFIRVNKQAYYPKDLVEVKRKDMKGWHEAIVQACNGDGTYAVVFEDDGVVDVCVLEANMKRIHDSSSTGETPHRRRSIFTRVNKQAYCPKDLVEVKRRGMKGWHEAVVQACNGDGTYVVRFENDGEIDTCVNEANIKHIRDSGAAADDLSVHRRRMSFRSNPTKLDTHKLDTHSHDFKHNRSKESGVSSTPRPTRNHNALSGLQTNADSRDCTLGTAGSQTLTEVSTPRTVHYDHIGPWKTIGATGGNFSDPVADPSDRRDTYVPNEAVKIKRDGLQGWFSGSVVAKRNDGNYEVRYEDGKTQSVPSVAIKSMLNAEPRKSAEKLKRPHTVPGRVQSPRLTSSLPIRVSSHSKRALNLNSKDSKDQLRNPKASLNKCRQRLAPVRYTTVDTEANSKGNIRESPSSSMPLLCKGDKVEARPRDMVGWHAACVVKRNSNGSVHVRYDSNGKVERFVPRSLIRRVYASKSGDGLSLHARMESNREGHATHATLEAKVRRDLFCEPQCEAKNCTAHALYMEELPGTASDSDECKPAVAVQTQPQKRMWCTKHKPHGAVYVGDATIARLLDIPRTHRLQRGTQLQSWGSNATHGSRYNTLFVFDGSSYSSFRAKPFFMQQPLLHLTFMPIPVSSSNACDGKNKSDVNVKSKKVAKVAPPVSALTIDTQGIATKTPRLLPGSRTPRGRASPHDKRFPRIVSKTAKAPTVSSGKALRPREIPKADVSNSLQVGYACLYGQLCARTYTYRQQLLNLELMVNVIVIALSFQEPQMQRFAAQIIVAVSEKESQKSLDGLYQAITTSMDTMVDDLVFARSSSKENGRNMFLFQCDGVWMFSPNLRDMASATYQLQDNAGHDQTCRSGGFSPCGVRQWTLCRRPLVSPRVSHGSPNDIMLSVTPIDSLRGVRIWSSMPSPGEGIVDANAKLISNATGLYSFSKTGNTMDVAELVLDTCEHGDKRINGTKVLRSDGRWCMTCAPQEALTGEDVSPRVILRSEPTTALTPVGLRNLEQCDPETGQWQKIPAHIHFDIAPEDVCVSGWIWLFTRPRDTHKQQCHFHTVLGGFVSALKCPGRCGSRACSQLCGIHAGEQVSC